MKRALFVAAAVAGAAVGVWVWKRRGSPQVVADASTQWAQAFSGAVDSAVARVDDLATATKRTVADLAATAGEAAEAAAEDAAEVVAEEAAADIDPADQTKKATAKREAAKKATAKKASTAPAKKATAKKASSPAAKKAPARKAPGGSSA